MDSGDESEYEPMSTEILEDIRECSQSCPIINRIEASYKIRDIVKQRQSEWKGMLKAMRKMGKGLHHFFKTVVKEISHDLSTLGESSSEFSYFVPEPRKFAEVSRLSEDIKKPWLKTTQKEIKNLINKLDFFSSRSREG